MLKIARIAIKKNAAFSDCIVVFGVKPYIVAYFCVLLFATSQKMVFRQNGSPTAKWNAKSRLKSGWKIG